MEKEKWNNRTINSGDKVVDIETGELFDVEFEFGLPGFPDYYHVSLRSHDGNTIKARSDGNSLGRYSRPRYKIIEK